LDVAPKTAAVVIPTYDEAPTIASMIGHLFEHTLPSIPEWSVHVVIVDGNSPDGTAEQVRALQREFKGLHLIVEQQKEGIGAAYFKGFKYAVEQLAADVFIEFDGDFQHPPEMIPTMLRRIDAGADLVLGSRRMSGGSYPSGWGFRRLFLSRVGGFVARFLLFFPTRAFFRVSDPTTGLKATRVAGFYDRMDFASFHTHGFGYKLEMLYRLLHLGARVAEVPLQFGLRLAGDSKITPQTPADIFKTVFHLRWHDEITRRFLRFAVVGFSGFLVNALTLELFAHAAFTDWIARHFTGLSESTALGFVAQKSAWSAAFAAECAIASNYIWSNFWTFSGYRARRLSQFIVNFLKFNLTSSGAILLQFGCIGLAIDLIADTTLVRQTALIFTIAFVVIPYNWLMYNRVIWRTTTPKHHS
jgi:dolichol-phosphate mannosyltransferase